MLTTIFYVGPAVELWDCRVVDGSSRPVAVEMNVEDAERLLLRDPNLWHRTDPRMIAEEE